MRTILFLVAIYECNSLNNLVEVSILPIFFNEEYNFLLIQPKIESNNLDRSKSVGILIVSESPLTFVTYFYLLSKVLIG